MGVGRRSAAPIAVVALLGVLSGAAAWLGVAQSPGGQARRTLLDTFLATTRAEGTLQFSETERSTPLGSTGGVLGSSAVTRTRGVLDFSGPDVFARSVDRGPGMAPQSAETVVVDGAAYQRVGADLGGTPTFGGPWLRLNTFALPPFGALAGPAVQVASFGTPHLRAIATMRIGGTSTTEYQVAYFSISCSAPSSGRPSLTVERTWVWVDTEDRIRQWANVTTERFGSDQSPVRFSTVTRFGHFGAAARVRAPGEVVGTAQPSPARLPNPVAGCLVTPR